jgi:hypothetical protein
MSLLLDGEIRKFVSNAYASARRSLRLTQHESFAVAQVEPAGLELARAGLRFYGGVQNGATGRAPVGSIPTTAAAWLLWNGESDGGASLVIDTVSIVQVSGTAAVGGAILWALTNKKIAAPTAATGYATTSASKSSKSSRAVWGDNQTLGETPTWGVLKANGNPATSTSGGDTVDVDGRIIVPPGFGLALHYLSGAGTSPLFGASATWSELQLSLE